jgi:hypothetical protein
LPLSPLLKSYARFIAVPLVLSSVAVFAGDGSDQSVEILLDALHSRVGGVYVPGHRNGEFVDRFISTDLTLNEGVEKGL